MQTTKQSAMQRSRRTWLTQTSALGLTALALSLIHI